MLPAPGGKVERPLMIRTAIALVLFGIGVAGSLGLVVEVPWALFVVGLSTLLGLPVRVIQAWALLVAALPVQTLASDTPTWKRTAGSADRADPSLTPTDRTNPHAAIGC